MKTAIQILEHELSYAKGNRAACKESDDFHRGWVKSLECAIGVLHSCDTASQPTVEVDARCKCQHHEIEFRAGSDICHNCGRKLRTA
jgi:hypothetical protein